MSWAIGALYFASTANQILPAFLRLRPAEWAVGDRQEGKRPGTISDLIQSREQEQTIIDAVDDVGNAA